MRARASLRVILHGKSLFALQPDTGARIIVQVHVRHLRVRRQRLRIYGESMILRGDLDISSAQVLYGVIGSAVTKLELVGRCTHGK